MIAGDIVKLKLGQSSGVTQLVGAPPNDRIHYGMLPQNPVYPAIMYKRSRTERLEGVYRDPGYAMITLQVVSFGVLADDAANLDEQIRLALERFGSSQPAGIPFAGATLYDIKPGATGDGYAPDIDKFFVTTDYTVCHLETTP